VRAGKSNLEEFLGSILRGAAKLLGCSSTNLILINERTQQIHIVQIGAMAVSYPILEDIEQVLGNLNGICMPMHFALDSLVYRAWRDRVILETSSLLELAGSAFQSEAVAQVAGMIGELRFICVPALTESRNYGVLLFTKEGSHPFSRQQREVLQRYARRIGEILENDLMGQGRSLVTQPPPVGPEYLLFDAGGQVTGETVSCGSGLRSLIVNDAMLSLQQEVRTLASSDDPGPRQVQLESGLSLELSRLTVGGQAGVLCALHRTGARADMSLENQLLQLTLGDSAPALFLDPEFNITSCNEATTQVLGYQASDLVRRPVGTLFREPREILEILGQQILYPDNPYCVESSVVVHHDGTLTPSRVEALLLADDRRQVVGFLLLIRAGSDDAQDTAGRMVVQERLATMGEMATQLAHEIRNPLVAIGATLDGLGREDNLAADQREILATLSREIARMDMILRDYLAARHDVSFTEINVAGLVNDTAMLLEGARKATGKRVTVSIHAEVTMVADYDAIKHVFFNLLLNALEASPEGGEVVCRADTAPHNLSVYVEDRGPGLAASATECFQPFFTTKANGTGLGLAVCQKIAMAHGGLVELRDRDGGGCQAALVLPRRRFRSPGH